MKSLAAKIKDPLQLRTPYGVLGLLLLCLLPGILLRNPWPLDELRYLEVVREMIRNGDYLGLQLGGQAYTHKLPLLFWEVAGLGSLTGLETAARLIPFFHAILLVLGTFRLLGTLGASRELALRGAALLAISPGTFYLGQMFFFDVPLAAALVWFVALAAPSIRRDQAIPWPAWLLLGLALFLKGPVALLQGLPPIFALILTQRGLHGLRPGLRTGMGVLLTLFPITLWVLALWRHLPQEAFDELVFGQTGKRLSGSLGHQQPFLFYLPVLVLFLFPWGTRLLGRKASQQENGWTQIPRILLLTVLAQVLVFSLIPTKAPHYIYPLLPFALPWLARRCSPGAGGWLSKGTDQFIRFLCLLVALMGFGILTGLLAHFAPQISSRIAALGLETQDLPRIPLGIGILVGALAAFVKSSMEMRYTGLLLAASLALLPTLDRLQRPQLALPLLKDQLSSGKPVAQLRPILHHNFNFLLDFDKLPKPESEEELRAFLNQKDAIIFGQAKHHTFFPKDLHLEVLVKESFFFRPFRVWRLSKD
jgi:4-amino-4-deoxy-L-arabinose transferase-like glycosyltransferase